MAYIIVLLGTAESPPHTIIQDEFITLEKAKVFKKAYENKYPLNNYVIYKCIPLGEVF